MPKDKRGKRKAKSPVPAKMVEPYSKGVQASGKRDR